MKNILILSLTLLIGLSAHRLDAQKKDSLTARWHMDSAKIYRPKKIAFDLIFDNRKSLIKGNEVDINGYNVGLIFRSRFRVGAGWYEIIEKNFHVAKGKQPGFRDVSIQYAMINFEYWLVNSRWLELAVPLEIGFGSINFASRKEDNITPYLRQAPDGFFIPSGLGVQLKIKPLRWIGVTGLLGYRKSLKAHDINVDFDGMYYSYGVAVFLGNIVTDLKYVKGRKRYRKAMTAL